MVIAPDPCGDPVVRPSATGAGGGSADGSTLAAGVTTGVRAIGVGAGLDEARLGNSFCPAFGRTIGRVVAVGLLGGGTSGTAAPGSVVGRRAASGGASRSVGLRGGSSTRANFTMRAGGSRRTSARA